MNPVMSDAIERLKELPDEAQGSIAPRLHDYLTRLEELRALIQEGLDSGPSEPLDMEAIKREARAEWEAEQRAGRGNR